MRIDISPRLKDWLYEFNQGKHADAGFVDVDETKLTEVELHVREQFPKEQFSSIPEWDEYVRDRAVLRILQMTKDIPPADQILSVTQQREVQLGIERHAEVTAKLSDHSQALVAMNDKFIGAIEASNESHSKTIQESASAVCEKISELTEAVTGWNLFAKNEMDLQRNERGAAQKREELRRIQDVKHFKIGVAVRVAVILLGIAAIVVFSARTHAAPKPHYVTIHSSSGTEVTIRSDFLPPMPPAESISLDRIAGVLLSGSLYDSTNKAIQVNCVTGCSAGGGGGTSSSFAAAFPATGTAIGVKNGANMVNLAADSSSNLLVAWTNPQAVTLTSTTITGTVAATQSGNWSTRTQDGAGNALTSNSTTFSSKFGLDINLLGTLGTAFSTAGKVDVKAADGDVFVRCQSASTCPVTATIASSQSIAVTNAGTFATQSNLTGNAAVISGQQAVTGSAVVLATNTMKNICVKALAANAINVYIGPSGVSTSTGMELAPGDSWCGPVTNSNVIFVIASTTGSSVSWIGSN